MAASIWQDLAGRLTQRLGKARFFRLMSLYPPYLGAGVRVTYVSPDVTCFEAELAARPWTQNFVGTQFGGSLYALADPWFMLILLMNLGPDYVVWDKAATIRFLRPGRGPIRVRCEVTPERLAELRAEADRAPKVEPTFTVRLTDRGGKPVAEVEKVLYIKRKRADG